MGCGMDCRKLFITEKVQVINLKLVTRKKNLPRIFLRLFLYSYIFQNILNIVFILIFFLNWNFLYPYNSVSMSLKEFRYIISLFWLTCNNFSNIIIFYHPIICNKFFYIIICYQIFIHRIICNKFSNNIIFY